MKAMIPCAFFLVALGCGSRNETVIHGDPGGAPVTLSITYQASAIATLATAHGFTRTIVVERQDPFFGPRSFGRRDPFPWGHGFESRYQPATRAVVLAGDGPAQAQLARVTLRDGLNSFAVPVRAGRKVTLSLQAYGGWEGWVAIGEFTAGSEPKTIIANIDANGARLENPEAPVSNSTTP